jgi:hypothetical protein
MTKWVTAWRKAPETAYLAEVQVRVLQNVVRALDGAFQRFFGKEGGHPKFKRRGDGSRSRCASRLMAGTFRSPARSTPKRSNADQGPAASIGG